jgi:hypothetical protein
MTARTSVYMLVTLLAGCAAHRPTSHMFRPDGHRLDCEARGDGFQCGPYTVGPHETGPEVFLISKAVDGPPAATSAPPVPAEHYANRFSKWFWTHEGPAMVVGAAIVVGIIAHKHAASGHAPPPTCGPGTGQTCQPGPPVSVCTGATNGIGVCPWWQ